MPKPVPTLLVGGSEDEPLVLAGPPTDLTGRIELHNPSDAKVVLRDAGLRDPSGVLTLPTARAAVQPLVLRPDQGGTLPLAVAVDPATPPGEYSAEIEVGGRSRAVVLRVAEVFDLRVEPRRLVVLNRPGVAQTKRLIVTNEGNVPFTLGDPVTVDLRRDPPRERTLRVALEPFLRTEEPELKDLVVAMLAIAREEERLGELQVRGERQVEVRPGETTALDVEITLYDELPPTRRYRGVLPVLTRDVDVVVVPSRGPEPAEKTPQRRRRTTTTTKRPPPKRGATA